MRRPALWFVVVHLLLVKVATAGTGDAPIIGGTPAQVGDWPAVVAIEVGGGLCTGTLITKDWVLTAAHCVTPAVVGLPSQAAVTASIKVHFNTVNVFSNPGTVATASDSIPDPNFNINSLGQYDSGLIKLSAPVTNVTPVQINFDPAKAPVGIMVTMVGFGATAVGGQGNIGIEYVVDQTSMSCQIAGGSDANLLCFNQTTGKGKCEGDSGGPSFAMIGGKNVEVGITSYGDQTCAQFGADTRVDAEKAFITAHVPALSCSMDSECPMGDMCFNHNCIVTPFQPGGLGSTCGGNDACDSGMCAMGPGGQKCTMTCTVGAADQCPAGLTCTDTGAGNGTGACWPHQDSGGCCDASGAGAPTMIFGMCLVGLVLTRRRRA